MHDDIFKKSNIKDKFGIFVFPTNIVEKYLRSIITFVLFVFETVVPFKNEVICTVIDVKKIFVKPKNDTQLRVFRDFRDKNTNTLDIRDHIYYVFAKKIVLK